MIAHLRGRVDRIDSNSVVVDVGGVGYRALAPATVLASLPPSPAEVKLYTTLVVREDDLTLYGFSSPEERSVFELATSVAGVGPKVALSMLGAMEAGDLARAISSSDARTLTRVPGVGPKLAQRIILELGERMAEFVFATRVEAVGAGSPVAESMDDIVEALVNLGYSRSDARKAAERATSSAPDSSDIPSMIRAALNLLASTGR